jgi:predicted Zn-dependent protease
MDPLDTAILLASLEARGSRRPIAVNTLKELAAANPGKPAPVEALAWMELGGPNPTSAIEPFHRALELGTRDASLCFTIATTLQASMPEADYLAALRRAAELDPAFSHAQEQLAVYAFNHHDYPEAIARLRAVKKLERSNAFVYWHMLAAASYQTGNYAEAKSAAARLQQYAATADQKRIAEELSKLVNSR